MHFDNFLEIVYGSFLQSSRALVQPLLPESVDVKCSAACLETLLKYCPQGIIQIRRGVQLYTTTLAKKYSFWANHMRETNQAPNAIKTPVIKALVIRRSERQLETVIKHS